jgi:hypothetical protein
MQIKEHSKTIMYTGLATIGAALAYLGYRYLTRPSVKPDAPPATGTTPVPTSEL